MAEPIYTPTDHLIDEACEWMLDCGFVEDPEKLVGIDPVLIQAWVGQHYEGGWWQFVGDSLTYDNLLLEMRYTFFGAWQSAVL